MRRLYPGLLMMMVAGFGAGCHKQASTPPQPAPQATAAPAAPAAPALQVSTDTKGKMPPDVEITDLASGQKLKLASFKGKPLLVNLWATWCAPCVRELPTIDKLAQAQADKLQVVAISEDMEGAKVVQPYLAGKQIKLHPYHDADNGLMLAYKEASLPVSILYGADGKEVWRLSGDLDWSGDKAKALLAEAGVQ